MQPDTVAPGRGPDVDQRMDVVGNGEVEGFLHQPEEGLFEF